jgi:protein involved in sex pheromone biosynthesis
MGTPEESIPRIGEVVKKHNEAINDLMDVLAKHNVSSAEGEMILLWCAGMSAGMRAQPIADNDHNDWLDAIAVGWTYGAERG